MSVDLTETSYRQDACVEPLRGPRTGIDCFGMVCGNLAALTHGACVVLPGASFEPAATLRAVTDERCTALHGVPTMFVAELALPDLAAYDLSSLRTGVLGGAPSSAELMTQITTALHLPEMTAAYGMTETSAISTQTVVEDSVHGDGRSCPSAHRGRHRRTRYRPARSARIRRRALGARLLGDATLLERPQFLGAGDEFPMTATGKVQKNVLKERASAVLSAI
jgi:acyl-CoA synthetase (AMP-forming)/AMP-acid ligase II